MRDIKFQFLYKGPFFSSSNTGFNWHKKVYTLDQLMEKSLSRLSDTHEICELVAKRQYTGLRDKNEVEIYEGDIVSQYAEWSGGYLSDDCGETESIGVVSITASSGVVMNRVKIMDLIACDEKWAKHPHQINVRGCRSRVIGNIHENPELLEVES